MLIYFYVYNKIVFLDITPTGSLRRRRGRPGSSEDEGGLMQFLRASSDSQKAAESWGSLGNLQMSYFLFSLNNYDLIL